MYKFIGIIILLLITGCGTVPQPHNPENVCEIFHQYPKWYHATKKTERKWGVSVPVQMAIMYYESSFRGDARPPRRYTLGFIPGKHISSAYGYAQALNGTWDDYLGTTGKFFASRTDFEDATDFIGWYSAQAQERLGISADNPYALYLAYHEGLSGYERRSYLKKPWLMRLAKQVAKKSRIFQHQMQNLEHSQPNFDIPNQMDEPGQLETPTFFASNEKNDEQEIQLY